MYFLIVNGSPQNQRWNKNCLETNEKKTQPSINLRYNKSISKREVFDTGLTQAYLRKQEKSQVNNLTLHGRELVKEQIKLKISRRIEIINNRTETNEIGTKRRIEEAY